MMSVDPPSGDFWDRLGGRLIYPVERWQSWSGAHEDRAFFVKSLFVIVLIRYGGDAILSVLEASWVHYILFLILAPACFMTWFFYRSITEGRPLGEILRERLTVLPIMYTKGEWERREIAWVTYSLIATNIVLYEYLVAAWGVWRPADVVVFFVNSNLSFLPEDPNWWNWLLSPVTSIFIHSSGGHLAGNMLILLPVGMVIEKRVGSLQFLKLYLLLGVLSGLLEVAIVWLASGGETLVNGVGASGAISGVMGLYAVRCYFKQIIVPLPVLGIFSAVTPVHVNFRISALLLLGIFFWLNLENGAAQLLGTLDSNIGYWAHLAGFVSAVWMGRHLGYHKDALAERQRTVGEQALKDKNNFGQAQLATAASVDHTPQDLYALLTAAQVHSASGPTSEGQRYWERILAILILQEPHRAVKFYEEYIQTYGLNLEDSQLQYRLAGMLRTEGYLDHASRSYELLADRAAAPGDLRQGALFRAASLLRKMGLKEAADHYANRLLREFPDSESAKVLKQQRLNAKG